VNAGSYRTTNDQQPTIINKIMSENVLEVNETNWETAVLQSDVPVLVDFWASWCGPCIQLTPTIEELATEMDGKVKVVKATIEDDHNKEIAGSLGIMGIPALIVYKGGEPVAKLSQRSLPGLVSELEPHTAPA